MTPAALKAWRRAHRISQGQLAELLGVPRNTVCQWESGRRGGPAGNLLMLSLAALDRMIGPHNPAIPEAE